MDWKTHLVVAPIVLPLVTAAVLLLFDERRRGLKNGNQLRIHGLPDCACHHTCRHGKRKRLPKPLSI